MNSRYRRFLKFRMVFLFRYIIKYVIFFSKIWSHFLWEKNVCFAVVTSFPSSMFVKFFLLLNICFVCVYFKYPLWVGILRLVFSSYILYRFAVSTWSSATIKVYKCSSPTYIFEHFFIHEFCTFWTHFKWGGWNTTILF